ncbi:MAG: amidohydrolase family protein [Anaerolineae bacterium]|nr:amidohydrolase family protein [Anaerolineae bacterium]MBT6062762.1 amidohydrolase family protein [Anaerolineae bacterium]MBT6813140.1 amidohydrolase family protein [Anaerolineae bacterium]
MSKTDRLPQENSKEWGIINCHAHVLPTNGINSLLFTWPFPLPMVTILRNPVIRWIFLKLGKLLSTMLVKWFGSTTLENRWDRLVALANMEFMILKKEKDDAKKTNKEKKAGKEKREKKERELKNKLYKKYVQYEEYENIKLGSVEKDKKQLHKVYKKFELVYRILEGNYPPHTTFVLLSLDTKFMFSHGKKFGNKVALNYEKQLAILEVLKEETLNKNKKELKKLKKEASEEKMGKKEYKKYIKELDKKPVDTVLPFIHADPRRKNITKIVKHCIKRRGFQGIKIYPPFGVLPYAPRLNGVYKYAQKKSIPIIAHCTSTGMTGYPFYDDKNYYDEKTPPESEEKNNGIYTHPFNYEKVLEEFPKLHLCLAHFGGNDEWTEYLEEPWDYLKNPRMSWGRIIIKMIGERENGKLKYPNLYTDISYTSFDPHTLALLKVHMGDKKIKELRKKILFGSDFPVLQAHVTDRAFSVNIRGLLGEKDFEQIASINPKKFLGPVNTPKLNNNKE